MSQWRSKIPYAATETWRSQIINKNKYFLKRGKFGQRHRHTEMMAMWMWKRRQRRRGAVNEPGTSWSHLSQKGQGESLPWSFSWSAAPPTPWLQNSGPQNSEAPFLLLEATTSGHLLQKPEETNILSEFHAPSLWIHPPPPTLSIGPDIPTLQIRDRGLGVELAAGPNPYPGTRPLSSPPSLGTHPPALNHRIQSLRDLRQRIRGSSITIWEAAVQLQAPWGYGGPLLGLQLSQHGTWLLQLSAIPLGIHFHRLPRSLNSRYFHPWPMSPGEANLTARNCTRLEMKDWSQVSLLVGELDPTW